MSWSGGCFTSRVVPPSSCFYSCGCTALAGVVHPGSGSGVGGRWDRTPQFSIRIQYANLASSLVARSRSDPNSLHSHALQGSHRWPCCCGHWHWHFSGRGTGVPGRSRARQRCAQQQRYRSSAGAGQYLCVQTLCAHSFVAFSTLACDMQMHVAASTLSACPTTRPCCHPAVAVRGRVVESYEILLCAGMLAASLGDAAFQVRTAAASVPTRLERVLLLLALVSDGKVPRGAWSSMCLPGAPPSALRPCCRACRPTGAGWWGRPSCPPCCSHVSRRCSGPNAAAR